MRLDVHRCNLGILSGVARAPQAPRSRGGGRGAEGPARGPPGRSSRRNPLARGPNKLFAGGPENRRYATGHTAFRLSSSFFWASQFANECLPEQIGHFTVERHWLALWPNFWQ